MALTAAAHGGVAGHIADAVKTNCKQRGLKSAAGAGKSSLNARVSRAYDRNIKIIL